MTTAKVSMDLKCSHCGSNRNMNGQTCPDCRQQVCRLCEQHRHLRYSYSNPHWICPVANPL